MIVLDEQKSAKNVRVADLLNKWDEIGRHASKGERVTMTKKQTKRALWLPKQPLIVDADPVVDHLEILDVTRDEDGTVWLEGRPSFSADVLASRTTEV